MTRELLSAAVIAIVIWLFAATVIPSCVRMQLEAATQTLQ